METLFLRTALYGLGAFFLAACSVLLPEGTQCEVDGDCRLVSHVCQNGLCVARGDGGSGDGGTSDPTVGWVLSYFTEHRDLAADSLHLAYSEDGLRWTPLGEGRPVFSASGIGTGHLRDPSIFRKNDGTFVLLATDFTLSRDDADYFRNPSPRIFVADSADLTEFTNPRLLAVTNLEGPSGSDMHAWSPEAFYDPTRGEYGILWAGNDESDTNRIYVTYVDDGFRTVRNRTPEVFFAPGYSVVDPTLTSEGGTHYLLFRDASAAGGEIQIARSSSLSPGSFERWSPRAITEGGARGPLVIRAPTLWYLVANEQEEAAGTRVWSASALGADPRDWEPVDPEETSFPRGCGQATAMRVTRAELDTLIEHYGQGYTGARVRTTLVEGGMPQYVLHDTHNVLGPLGLTQHGIGPDDYLWKIRPGLADPSDDSLVSIESATQPGFFWRVRSASPNAWPPADGGNYRDEAFASGSSARHHHLVYLDRADDSDPTFAADATFERVPALNGRADMVSFRWHREPTRFVGHFGYHLVAQEEAVQGSSEVMSFAIEE